MKPTTLSVNRETTVTVHNGWTMLVLVLALILADIGLLVWSIAEGVRTVEHPLVLPFLVSLLTLPVWIILLVGFFTGHVRRGIAGTMPGVDLLDGDPETLVGLRRAVVRGKPEHGAKRGAEGEVRSR
mgnify:CR=1 FL=1